MRFDDRVALITGAARGIGRACAERFLAEGARVVLADIDEEAGRAAELALRETATEPDRVGFVACDVADSACARLAVEQAISWWGRLDICVANAAVVHAADFLDIEEADFDRVLGTNLKGVFLIGPAAARAMVAGGHGGSIVNMSSINAQVALAEQVPYCVAKGGIQQLTKVQALSLAHHGIRANAVGPGSIATEMLESVISSDPAARHKVLSRTPAGRLGRVEEIAAVTAFLASDEAAYITGQTLYADGGRLALNYTVAVPEDDAS